MSQYTIQTETEQYVFHITSKKRRNDISEKGLLACSNSRIGYDNAVFAHNSSFLSLEWYPFTMDYYYWDFIHDLDWTTSIPGEKEILRTAITLYYDIWQIDTRSLNRTWYVDSVAQRDFGGNFFKPEGLYVMSYGNIPPEYLTLCEAGTDQMVCHKKEGVSVVMTLPAIIPVIADSKQNQIKRCKNFIVPLL